MKVRLLHSLLLILGFAASVLFFAPPVLAANDNCCGYNGQMCNSDQDWQNGWNACNNNACPGYGGCAKGSSSSSSSGGSSSSSGGASGSNICGAGGANGCAGKPVGYIINAGTERLKCFKQTPQSTSCARQYVDSQGNYTSGSDNSSSGGSGSGSSGSGSSSSPSSSNICASGSVDPCNDGKTTYNTQKVIPGTSTLVACQKREDSAKCKRVVLTHTATPNQQAATMPNTGEVCAGLGAQCRKVSDECRKNGDTFRCTVKASASVPNAGPSAGFSYRLREQNSSPYFVCGGSPQKCESGELNCFASEKLCSDELQKRVPSFEQKCRATQGKVLTCGQKQYCLPTKVSDITSCAELQSTNTPPTTTPDDLKNICKLAGASKLEECRVMVKENGTCGAANQVCSSGLECLQVSGQPNLKTCQKPEQRFTYYRQQDGTCSQKQLKRSEAEAGIDFESAQACAQSLYKPIVSPEQRYIIDSKNQCLQVTQLACTSDQTCFKSLEACQQQTCQISTAKLNCSSSSGGTSCVSGVAQCQAKNTGTESESGVYTLGQGERCVTSNNYASCICQIGALKLPLLEGDTRACSPELFGREQEIYAQEGDLCGNKACEPNKSLTCSPAPNTPEYADLSPGEKVCVGPTSLVARVALGQVCARQANGSSNCAFGLSCEVNPLKFSSATTCVDLKDPNIACAQKGENYRLCQTQSQVGVQSSVCINTLNGSCSSVQSSLENNLVSPGQRRWKLAVNQGACVECRSGESLSVCRYSNSVECGNVQTGLNTKTFSGQLKVGEICQAQDSSLHQEWCESGLLCAPIPVDYGSPGPARCQNKAVVDRVYNNDSCGRVDSQGRLVPDHSQCFGATCMYDGSKNGYVCKSPDTQVPEANRRVISPNDRDRICWDSSGCLCAVASNGQFTNVAIETSESCPVPENQDCSPEDFPGSVCGENSTGRCVKLNDSAQLICKNLNDIQVENDSSSGSCSAICNCKSSTTQIQVNYCQPPEMTCSTVCQSAEVQTKIAEKEEEQRQTVARALESIRSTVTSGINTVLSLYTSFNKVGRVTQTRESLSDAAVAFQIANQLSSGPQLLDRNSRCSSGLQCQSGICTSNSKLTQTVSGNMTRCAEFADLLADGQKTCLNDAACASGKCNRGTCESSTYQTPQLLIGQRCPEEAGLGCLCRLPDGSTTNIERGVECLVPISGTCTYQSQCAGVGVCQGVSATRSECVASQSQILTPILNDRAAQANTQGNQLKNNNETCTSGVQCKGGFCIDHDKNTTTAKQCAEYDQLLDAGQSCGSPGQCRSGNCVNFLCTQSEQKRIVFPGEVCRSSDGCQCRGDEEALPTTLEIGEGARCLVSENEVCTLSSQCSDGFLCVSAGTNQPSVCRNPNNMITEERTCVQTPGKKFCSQCWNAYNFQVSASSSDPSIPAPGTPPAFCVDSTQSCSCPDIPGGQ